MKALVITGLVAVLIAAAVVSAHGMGRMGMYNQDMQKVLEEGSYQDLVELRQTSGMPMMPWVTDQASFETMQQHHVLMQSYQTKSGKTAYGGMRMGCH